MEGQTKGAHAIADYFRKAGIKYVFGIPGHGNAAFVDVLKDYSPDVEFVAVKHEQWGGHMADGYFRANRKVPAVVTTSVGPGATNLATALATAYVDSSSFIAVTGQVQTYLFGRGIFQEIERQNWVDYVNAMKHLTKRAWLVSSASQLPRVLYDAHKTAVSGRPGPVLIDVPMDVQVERMEAKSVSFGSTRFPHERVRPDARAITEAARLLVSAERPLILIGGGVAMAGASDELIQTAEFLGAPVVCSFRGDAKGGFPENHELYAFHPGNIGNPVANKLATEADVILAVGVTFSDETTSSYSPGVSFNIPPTKLIHMDIDPHEIGKNYLVEVGIVADAKAGLSDLNNALREMGKRQKDTPYLKRLKEMKAGWEKEMDELRRSNPMGIPNVVKLLRSSLPEDAIVSVSAGLPQEIMSQLWATNHPNTFISSGGFSTMGFALPAAMGAKLAKPRQTVVAVEGDGSFLMNSVELLTAVQLDLPVTTVVLNNYGWISIRDLQMRNFEGRLIGTEFKKIKDGSSAAPDFEKLVKAYGAEYARAEKPEEIGRVLREAVRLEVPSVVEIPVENKFPNSGTKAYGFWDLPRRKS
jgi:acetolactate synthase-1/2/3 large subunit